jgi:hypothetical protein
MLKIREYFAKNYPQSVLKVLFRLYTYITGTRWKKFVIFRQRILTKRKPKTYSQKLRYKMTYDRREILTQFADKIAVREIVAEKVGPQYLSKIIQIAQFPSEIDWEKLPREFVCKTNHMSGGNILVWDGAPEEARLPKQIPTLREKIFQVKPEHLDYPALETIVTKWLNQNYAWIPGRYTYEWAYENIEPKVFVEELLKNQRNEQGLIFRFHVFNGIARVIRYPGNRQINEFGYTVSRNWEMINATFKGHPIGKVKPERPKNMDEMIWMAETLGALVDYVRVDIYDLDDRIVLSELTNYPLSGATKWEPKSFDSQLGSYWQIEGYSH